MKIKERFIRFINFWPPFLFSGIKILEMSEDYRKIRAKLKLRFWNTNYVGTQYGGSIYSLSDPFYMLMIIKNLGPEYSVWDKAANIHFIKPGKSDLFADFNLSELEIEDIKTKVEKEGRLN